MKSILAIMGLLIFAYSAAADTCSEAQAEACVSEIIQMSASRQHDIDCGALRSAKNCLIELADRCLDENEKEEAQEQINSMVNTVNSACPVEEDDNAQSNEIDDAQSDDDDEGLTDREKEMIECLDDEEKLMTYVGYCSQRTMIEMSSGSSSYGNNMRDLNCQAFLSIARCVSGKVGDGCGSEIEEPFFSGMMSALKKEDPRAAQSSQCAAAIAEAERYIAEHSRKRRSVANVSFAKLLR